MTHGLACQALLARLAGDQAGGDQHRRVGGVGAAGDRGDDDVAVAEVEVRALDRHARVVVLAGRCSRARALNWSSTSLSSTRSCGRLGPASDGSMVLMSSSSVSVNTGSGDRGVAPQALRLGIGPDQRDLLVVAAGQLEIVDRPLVDREEAAGRAIFGRHVGDRRAVGERSGVEARPVEFDEAADDALLAQHLGDGQHQVGRGDAFLELARRGGSRRLRGSAC